jgi:hypothetical protein
MTDGGRNDDAGIFFDESIPVDERFRGIGLRAGEKRDLRDLIRLRREYSFEIYLYLDEDLARGSELSDDLRAYEMVPPPARPFVSIDDFLRFLRGRDPGYQERWNEEPLIPEIIDFGLLEVFYGCVLSRTPYLKCLLPG